MFKKLRYFHGLSETICLASPADAHEAIAGWQRLRSMMTRRLPAGFGRDEWAYLISFLEPKNLEAVYAHNLGKPVTKPVLPLKRLLRPRRKVAIWLPNNVSLLGPLLIVLCSLSGIAVRIKGGSKKEDFTGIFLRFAKNNLPHGRLREYLSQKVEYAVFPHADPRGNDFFRDADTGIIFGSDEAVEAVKDFPRPLNFIGFPFPDRNSQAWLELPAVNDGVLIELLKVFAVYGRAGCSSPAKVILLGGTMPQAVKLQRLLRKLWNNVFCRLPPAATASQNVKAFQLAKAAGWQPVLTTNHASVIAVGSISLPPCPGEMTLSIVPATVAETVRHLPEAIQTVGYALAKPQDPRWLELVAKTQIKRFVPIARMHHFGPLWDGYAFWRGLFEEVELSDDYEK